MSKTKCFSCGSLGHIARYCRKRKANGISGQMRNKQDNRTRNNEDQSGSIGVSKIANEAGMLIKAKVNGLNANMLVDRGATVAIIKMFESMASPVMTEMTREIITASGSKLNVLGKTIIDIDINGYVCSNVVIVADINVDGILGLDFQRSHNCTINVAKGSILIHDHKVSLQFEGQIGCYRVTTAKTVEMTSRKDVIVKRKVKDLCFLGNKECSVYKKQRIEKCCISCMQCNKDFKKAAYFRRHMQKCHAYKTASLEQASEISNKEKHEDMKEPESNKTDISDPGDVMDLIMRVTSAEDLSSGGRIRDTDEMCGFCPQTKTQGFPEVASFWRDPFEIKKKVYDVLYEIDCSKTDRHGQYIVQIVDSLTNILSETDRR